MQPREMQTLYAYNTWANSRILDTAARLSPDQLTADVGASFPSVLSTLTHLLAAQALYLSRCLGDPHATMPEPTQFSDLDTLRATWRPIDDRTHQFLGTLDAPALDRTIAYVNAGTTWTYPLWQILVHQVNHATQHRSEVAVMLTQFGHSPGWLDFLVFIDEQ